MDEYLASCLVMLAHGQRQPPSPPDHQLTHKCAICFKKFSSYQALGGHKSSHRKSGVWPVSVSSVSSGGSAASSAGLGLQREHKCNFCHRVFATGPALGGHKRKHYLDGGSSRTVEVRPVRDFDLNLPASSWMDDEDVQTSCL